MMPFLLFFGLLSCSSTPVTLAQNCDVRMSSLEPLMVHAGDTVRATGGPMTSVWDTAVYLDTVRAEVVALDRIGCEECDTCKRQNSCSECDDCDECDAICIEQCIESIDFIAPEMSADSANVSFYNGHGQSNAIVLHFGAETDTGQAIDSGEIASPVDTGSSHDTSSK